MKAPFPRGHCAGNGRGLIRVEASFSQQSAKYFITSQKGAGALATEVKSYPRKSQKYNNTGALFLLLEEKERISASVGLA